MRPAPAQLRRWAPAALGLGVLAVALLLPLGRGSAASGEAAAPTVATSLAPSPSAAPLAAVTGERPPAPGTVRLVAGPFTDRVALLSGKIQDGAATGLLDQAVETSSLINLEVQADFYDASGDLLGSRKKVLGQRDVLAAGSQGNGDQRYGGDIAFSVPAPEAMAGKVSSALLSVPVLVNE